MKITYSALAPAISRRQYPAFLLYGNHETLERGLLEEINEGRILSEEEFCQNPASFLSPTLFGPAKPVILFEISEKNIPLYQEAIAQSSVPLILTTTKLKTTHALVVQFVQSSTWAALGCYDPCPRESRTILKRYVERQKLNFDLEAFEVCAQLAQEGHWARITSLLQLLPGIITSAHLQQLFPEFGLETHYPLSGDRKALLAGLRGIELLGQVSDVLGIIRLWQRLFMQIWQWMVYVQNGQGAEAALKKVMPPIFFKHNAAILALQKSWTVGRLYAILDKLFKAEKAAKTTDASAAVQHLLELLSLLPIPRSGNNSFKSATF